MNNIFLRLPLFISCHFWFTFVSAQTIASGTDEIYPKDMIYLSAITAKKQTVTYYYFDKFLHSHPPVEVSQNEPIKLRISYPVLLINARTQIPIVVFPGGSILLKAEGSKWVFESLTNPLRDNDLVFFDSLY